MSYKYEDQKRELFTDAGSRRFHAMLKHCRTLLDASEAFTMAAAMRAPSSGDTWQQMACVDRMVELGEIREVHTKGAAQCRVFVLP